MRQVSRAVRWLLASPGGLALIVVTFAIVELIAVATDHYLHDEGVLTYLGPRYLPLDPAALLFFAKLRPTVSIAYALPALLGYDAFLIVHVAAATGGLVLLARVSQALGHALPNLAALVLATSPVYLAAGAGGLSNGDGVVMTVLALYLLVVRRAPVATGLALSAACFVRFELATFAAIFGLFALFQFEGRARARFVAAAVLLPFAYVAAGAAYHGDLFWLVRLPPTGEAIPGHLDATGQSVHVIADVLGLVLSVSPLFGFAVLAFAFRLDRVERALALFVVAYHAIMTAFPVFDLLGVGLVGHLDRLPRYSMLSVGAVALLATRCVSRLTAADDREDRPAVVTALLLVFLVLAIVSDLQVHTLLSVAVVAIYCAVWVAARANASAVTALIVVGLALSSPFLPTVQRARDLDELAAHRPMTRWVRAHLAELGDAPVLTNSQLLRSALRHDARASQLDLRFIIEPQMASELLTMTNVDNGQQEAVRRMLDYEFYASPTWFDELDPDRVPVGSFFVVENDEELPLVVPQERWEGRLAEVHRSPAFSVWRVLPFAASTPESEDAR